MTSSSTWRVFDDTTFCSTYFQINSEGLVLSAYPDNEWPSFVGRDSKNDIGALLSDVKGLKTLKTPAFTLLSCGSGRLQKSLKELADDYNFPYKILRTKTPKDISGFLHYKNGEFSVINLRALGRLNLSDCVCGFGDDERVFKIIKNYFNKKNNIDKAKSLT